MSMWAGQQEVEGALASLAAARSAVRRRSPGLLVYLFCIMALGAVFVATAKPVFIASTQLVLQPRTMARDGPENLREYHQFSLDGQQLETELHKIRSERALRHVFDALNLARSAEFGPGQSGWPGFSGLMHPFGEAGARGNQRADAFAAFAASVTSRRLALSYVVEIGFRAHDPVLAARIVNAVESEYIRDRMTSPPARDGESAPYLISHAWMMLAGEAAAADAVRRGTVPVGYLPGTDVRLLGPAIVPQAKVFPKAGPVLILCAALGLISGLLGILILDRADHTVRSGAQILDRLGVHCLGTARDAARTGPRHWPFRRGQKPDGVPPRDDLRAVYARILAGRPGPEAPVIGIAAWSSGPAGRVATALATVLIASGVPVALVDLDRPAPDPEEMERFRTLCGSTSRDNAVVVALPPLAQFGAQVLVGLDATVLVAEVDQTALSELGASLRLARSVEANLTGVLLEQRC